MGIPGLRDRVAQTSAMLVLMPIFEADLEPERYGYRPGRSAKDAVRRVPLLLRRGRNEVVDADLSNYFGEMPHAELMKSVPPDSTRRSLSEATRPGSHGARKRRESPPRAPGGGPGKLERADPPGTGGRRTVE